MMFFLRILIFAAWLLLSLVLACIVYIVGVHSHLRWIYRHLPTPKCQRNSLFGALREIRKTEEEGGHLQMLIQECYLKGLMYQYNESAEEMLSYLRPRADGKTKILMANEMNKVALDIIAKVAFGLNDLNSITDESAPFRKAVKQSLAGFLHMVNTPYIWRFDFRRKTRLFMEETVHSIRLIRGIGKRCILKRIDDIKAGLRYPGDILTHILKLSNNLECDEEFGLEEMIDEFVTFFIAGQETTAQLMSFTFELAGRNPHVYERMQEEVDRVLGKKEHLSYQDISRLEYMDLVFKEVMRYIPPAPALQRISSEELVVNGYRIPAGSDIMISQYVLSRDERFWDNPEEFNPERFREEDVNRHYTYFPFSLGSRNCIGQQFAMIEARVIIAKLLQTFDYHLVPGVELRYFADITVQPKNRTPLYLTPRNVV